MIAFYKMSKLHLCIGIDDFVDIHLKTKMKSWNTAFLEAQVRHIIYSNYQIQCSFYLFSASYSTVMNT